MGWDSVRLANELGKGHSRSAKFSVIVAVLTAIVVAFLISLLLFLEKSRYPAMFSGSKEIQKVLEELTPLLGLSIILTCLQGTLSGTLLHLFIFCFLQLINFHKVSKVWG